MGRDPERRDTNLSENTKYVGVNSQKEVVYTSIYNLDLREQKNNRKTHVLTWKLNLGKTTGRKENSLFAKDHSELNGAKTLI